MSEQTTSTVPEPQETPGPQEESPPEAAPAAKIADKSQEENPVRPRSGRGLAVFALLLSVAAAGTAAYLWYRVEVQQKLALESRFSGIAGAIQANGQEVKQIAATDAALRQRQDVLEQAVRDQLSKQFAALKQQQDDLTQSLQKVYTQLNRSLDSWALEEVEQLLRIANHSLLLSGNINTAVAALELADQRLQRIGDPNYLDVRREIAQEIAALKSVPPVDVPGLSLRLAGMAQTLGQLPLVNEPQRNLAQAGATKASPPAPKNWLASTQELLTDTLGLIRIQNVSAPVRPLLTPEQRYFLVSNLRLMLSGAQLAVLRGDPVTWRNNLEQAGSWLKEYFDTNDERVKQLADGLGQMEKLDISPKLPQIGRSLTALDAARKQLAARPKAEQP